MTPLVSGLLAAVAVALGMGPPPRHVPVRAPTLPSAGGGVLGVRSRLMGGAAAAVLVWGLLPGPRWGSAIVAGLVAVAVFWGLGRIAPDDGDIEERRLAGIPEALTLLACGVEAGLPLRAVVTSVAPTLPGVVGGDLARVCAGLEIGLAERDAWGVLTSSEAWRRIAVDVGRVATSGATVAPILRRHEEQLARRDHDARIERARTTGVRSVFPLMTCFLPSFVLVGVVPTVGGMLQRYFG